MLGAAFWKKYFEVYDTLNELMPYRRLLDSIANALALRAGSSVLDAGCGTGNMALLLKKRNVDVVGIDSSAEALERCRSKGVENALFGNIEGPLPFPDGSFDAICSNNVLYAVSPVKRPGIAKEFYRVLKPGGTVVLSNLKRGFSPAKIYLAHLKEKYRAAGLIALVREIFSYAIPTVRIFYYNFLIIREHQAGAYRFMEKGEQSALLASAGFAVEATEQETYAHQALLAVARKPYSPQ